MALGAQFGPGFYKPPSGNPQQGVLFQQPKPREPERYAGAKGYSPERRREMGAKVLVKGPDRDRQGQQVRRQQIEDAVYRSTAPVPKEPIEVSLTGVTDPKAAGRYYPGEGLTRIYRVGTEGLATHEQTTLHELGHHQSYVEHTEHSRAYKDEPQKMGREEAFADDFMISHHVPRRNQGAEEKSAEEHAAGGYEKSSQWHHDYTSDPAASWTSYIGARKHSLASDRQQSADRAQHQQALGLDAAGNWQPHLFQRDADIEETDTHYDYGQFGFKTPEGESMTTLRSGRGVPENTWKPGTEALQSISPAQFAARRDIGDYKALNEKRRKPFESSMAAYERYGSFGGVRNAIEDWKKGEFK